MKLQRKTRIIASAVTLSLVATLAMAAWLASGTGDSRGRVGSLQNLIVTSSQTPGSACLPGGFCDASVSITNPNSAAMTIQSISDNVASPFQWENGSCVGQLNVVEKSGLSIPLPTGTTEFQLADVFQLSTTAPNSCQGTVFLKSITVTAST